MLIAASDPSEFRALAAARDDDAIVVTALSADETPRHPALAAIPHIVLDGLENLNDPVALLTALRSATATARLFAVVSNAAHVWDLAALVNGAPATYGHPLVHDEIAALFSAAGWLPLGITPVPDPSLPVPAAFPAAIGAGRLAYRVDDRPAFERAATSAFIVVADPQ